MPRGDPSPKMAITVSSQVHDMVIAAAAEEGVSVSAWMTEAARRRLTIANGLQAVMEWELENGAFTPEELAAARASVLEEMRIPPVPKAKRRRSA